MQTISTTLLDSTQICNAQKSSCVGEGCTAVLFCAVMVVSVYVPDPATNFKEYEQCVQDLMEVLVGGSKKEAKASLHQEREY